MPAVISEHYDEKPWMALRTPGCNDGFAEKAKIASRHQDEHLSDHAPLIIEYAD
jgi:hypothetical protein